MNNIKLAIIFIVLTSVPHLIARKSYKRESNAFYKLHKHIQKVINKLFLFMRLNKNFTSEYNSRVLLSMHANMKNIAEDNYEMYKGIRKICKLDVAKKLKGSLFKLDKLIEVFVEDELLPGNNTKENQRRSFGLKLTSIEIPGNSEESIIFLRDYLNTIDDMQIVGIETPTQKIKANYEKYAQLKLVKSKNLKKWKVQKETYESPVNDTRRIYHGKMINVRKFPFVVSVHVQDEFVCAGSIISKDMVLTAATCLQTLYNTGVLLRDTPEGVEVRMGSNYVNSDGETRLISKVFFHPEYDPVTLNNNLAILKIKKQLHFVRKNKKIRRIDFSGLKPELVGQDVVLLGWGEAVTDDDNTNLEPLSFTALNQFDISKCVDVYSSTYVSDANLCAGRKAQGSGACRRDVGGPGVIGSFLVGVVSFGPPICGTPDAPTVFTNLGYHLEWINSVVKQTSYSPLKAGSNMEPTTPGPEGNTTNVAQIVGNILTDLLANGINLDEFMISGDDVKNQDSGGIDVESLFETESPTEPETTVPTFDDITDVTVKKKKSNKIYRMSATHASPKREINPFLVALNKITKFINYLRVPFENAIKNISVDDAAESPNPQTLARMGKGVEKPQLIYKIDPDNDSPYQYAVDEPMAIGFGGLNIKSLPPKGAATEKYVFSKREWYARQRSQEDKNDESAAEGLSIEVPVVRVTKPVKFRNIMNKRIIANKFLKKYLGKSGRKPAKKVMKTNDILRFLLKQKLILQKKAQEYEERTMTSVTPALILRKSVGINDTMDYPNYSDFLERSRETERLMAAYNFAKVAEEDARRNNILDYINII